jgi:AraC-like DNA-binding protein
MHGAEHVTTEGRDAAHKQFGMVPSATGGIARLAYARAQEAGIPPLPLLSASGLALAQIEDRHTRLRVKDQITFLRLVADALPDDLLGFHLARDFDLREIGLIYYVMASSEMLEESLRRADRYSSIVNEGIRTELRCGRNTEIGVRYEGVERHSDRHQMEFLLTTTLRLCRQLTSRRLAPSRVNFLHRRREDRPALEAFFGCQITFGASADAIVFPQSLSELPITSADPYLNEMLIEYCENVLSRRKARRGSLRPDLENAIALLLPHGKAHAEEISRKLGMSERTLARRLSAEGLTFARVLDELKVELAKRYLQERDLQISEIAWLLGYREPSALAHACNRWFGKSPREMRSSGDYRPKRGPEQRPPRLYSTRTLR